MGAAHIDVIDWPDHAALQQQWAAQLPCVIRIAADFSDDRRGARSAIRTALIEALACVLPCAPQRIVLRSTPGSAPQVAGHDVAISITHAPGMSLAALARSAAIGIDVLHLPSSTLPAHELVRLAHDYLGTQAQQQIAEAPGSAQARTFATAWTAHEAGLKCLGHPLIEWSNAPRQQLVTLQGAELALPPDWVGAVCWSAR
ncbi:MAG: 4'-phosphopantetheinyl transferase superfamily protein [Pseudomonadota bacterium]|nr:4'-phosphopantetheinyl transferase superfamily protein [Pseudomonadota bacterium]